jgi:hypothetical protein
MNQFSPAGQIVVATDNHLTSGGWRAERVRLFHLEHRRCGELEAGVEDDRVWMTCSCGAVITRPLQTADPQ